MTKTRGRNLVMALLAVAAVGCSDGARALSPVGPSPVAETPASTSAARTWATSNGWATMADGRVAVADGLLIEGVDVIGAVSGSCPTRTITVRGVPVQVTSTTAFVAPLTCDSLQSGVALKVTGLLFYLPSGISVAATQLAPAAPAPVTTPAPVRGTERAAATGVVDTVVGSCPTVSFTMMGHRIETSAATVYEGGTCESLRPGVRIALEVARRGDGTVAAESIAFAR